MHVASGNARPKREATHVRRQHGGDGEFRGAEDQRELPHPRCLIQQCSESREDKTDNDAEKDMHSDYRYYFVNDDYSDTISK